MELVILEGLRMTTRAAAHDELARALQLPDYYGRNLDALWDMATTMQARVRLEHAAEMAQALGAYGAKLIATLREAADRNPAFEFSCDTDNE